MGRKSYPLSRRRLQAVRKRYRMRLMEVREQLNSLSIDQLERLAEAHSVDVPAINTGLKKAHTISRLLMRLTEKVSLAEERRPEEVETILSTFIEEVPK